MDRIIQSEEKRLRSLKEKKRAFKLKEQLIHTALSNLGNTTKNNKIIFDDNIGEEQDTNIKSNAKLKRKKINIFDSDEENDNSKEEDNENEFNKWEKIDDNMQFPLDNRFIINNNSPEDDLQKEKEKQLDILESVLGKPLTVKNPEKSDTKAVKNGLMIRYDPTENKHCEYEIKPAINMQSTSKKKNKKMKHEKPIEPKINESPPEVSKDIYYSISDNLTQNIKGEFSLLNTLGRDSNDTECVENNDASTLESKDKFRFNFSANKCDSFNEEIDGQKDREAPKLMQIPDADIQMIEEVKDDKNICNLFEHKDTLFFDNNDVRFRDAEKFFDVEVMSTDEFKNLRRELKQIVRTKIRNNEKRCQSWNKKGKIRKHS